MKFLGYVCCSKINSYWNCLSSKFKCKSLYLHYCYQIFSSSFIAIKEMYITSIYLFLELYNTTLQWFRIFCLLWTPRSLHINDCWYEFPFCLHVYAYYLDYTDHIPPSRAKYISMHCTGSHNSAFPWNFKNIYPFINNDFKHQNVF